MGLNSGRIELATTELDALEHLNNIPIVLQQRKSQMRDRRCPLVNNCRKKLVIIGINFLEFLYSKYPLLFVDSILLDMCF